VMSLSINTTRHLLSTGKCVILIGNREHRRIRVAVETATTNFNGDLRAATLALQLIKPKDSLLFFGFTRFGRI